MEDLKLDTEMIDRARRGIGKTHPSRGHWETITAEIIRQYALGIGDDNPLYWNEEVAKESPWGSIIAPPTFIWTNFQAPLFYPSDSQARSSGGSFPGMQGQFAGGQFRFHQPVKPGDKLHSTTTRIGIIDPNNRIEGELVNAEAQVEKALEYGMTAKAGYDAPAALQVEYHQTYNQNDELVGELYDHLLRIEPANFSPSEGKYKDVTLRSYTDEEMDRIAAQYDTEADNRRGPNTRYWNDVEPGEAIPQLVKGPLTILSYTAFFLGTGAWFNFTDRVMYNFIKRFPDAIKRQPETNIWAFPEEMHWDPYVAGLLGMPVGFDVGSQRFGWFANAVTDWMSDDGFCSELDVWFPRPMFLNETCWVNGKVIGKEEPVDGKGKVEIELWADTIDGVRLSDGRAVVILPAK